ncbi:YceI family protein [Tahibacter amnicola]|uniref:YceI family protein n=1 Tax=Tahibacter amnicola TaxID=2976241 RepID=A0ABY6BJB5_9GAMM|nr:YceI family protein [Tahibacter amnicola]UXI68470.1 YceI family protein [Tahibacter amnicola]
MAQGRPAALWHGLALAGLCALTNCAATAETIALDRQRSSAEFTVRALWLMDISGRFSGVSGHVRIDAQAGQAQVEAVIDARRVDMRRQSHETWVKSAEFFDVAQFPVITFTSEPFPLAVLDSGGDIPGKLTVRGIQRPTRFHLAASQCPGRASRACPVQAEGAISRAEFGMRSRRGTLSDRVRLHFVIFAAAAGDSS